MKRKIKYIFFDLGDTLLDMSISRKALDFGVKEVIYDNVVTDELFLKWKKESYITFERYFQKNKFFTVKRLQEISLRKVLLNEGFDLENDKLSFIIKRFWEYFIRNCLLYDDTMPTLSQLIHGPYQLGLITNGDEGEVNSILKQHKIDSMFKIKVISSVIKSYKPNPSLFKCALELANCLPEEAIYVGDSFTDVYGAKQLGVNTVIVCRTETQDFTINDEEDFRVDALNQLLAIIDEIGT